METSQFVNISLTTGDLDVHDSADLVSIGKDGVRQFVYPIAHHSAMVLSISWNPEAFSLFHYPATKFLLYFDYIAFIYVRLLYRYLQFAVLAQCCIKVSIFFLKTIITFIYLLLFDVCPLWHTCRVETAALWSPFLLPCGLSDDLRPSGVFASAFTGEPVSVLWFLFSISVPIVLAVEY